MGKENTKIVIASDSFKGSMSSMDVAFAARDGILELYPDCEVVMIPVADGGEGTAEALTIACGGQEINVSAKDPLGRPVMAGYGIINSAWNGESSSPTAVIDVAAASGLPLLSKDELNPLMASTFGTGELIRDALSRGCRKFVIGLGGSATNDGGMGMLEALGYNFLDVRGNVLRGCGQSMAKVFSIDASGVVPELKDAVFRVACDVDTPFCGPSGCAEIFAPQKGANPAMVAVLDEGMKNFARVIAATFSARDAAISPIDISRVPGTGAAGGLGGAFLAFLGAELVPGIEMVLQTVDFDARIEGADMVITGEGKIDSQTLKGKTPFGILQHASAKGIRTVAICGRCLDREILLDAGFADIREISPAGLTLAQMMEPSTARANVRRTVTDIVSTFLR